MVIKKYLKKLSLKPYYFDLNNIYTSNEIMKFIRKKYKFFQQVVIDEKNLNYRWCRIYRLPFSMQIVKSKF